MTVCGRTASAIDAQIRHPDRGSGCLRHRIRARCRASRRAGGAESLRSWQEARSKSRYRSRICSARMATVTALVGGWSQVTAAWKDAMGSETPGSKKDTRTHTRRPRAARGASPNFKAETSLFTFARNDDENGTRSSLCSPGPPSRNRPATHPDSAKGTARWHRFTGNATRTARSPLSLQSRRITSIQKTTISMLLKALAKRDGDQGCWFSSPNSAKP